MASRQDSWISINCSNWCGFSSHLHRSIYFQIHVYLVVYRREYIRVLVIFFRGVLKFLCLSVSISFLYPLLELWKIRRFPDKKVCSEKFFWLITLVHQAALLSLFLFTGFETGFFPKTAHRFLHQHFLKKSMYQSIAF